MDGEREREKERERQRDREKERENVNTGVRNSENACADVWALASLSTTDITAFGQKSDKVADSCIFISTLLCRTLTGC